MREIKFRAWDKENKEMLDIEDLHWDDCIRDFSIRTTMYRDYFDIKDMILMQYTGLKDKNGKEIYEGDIVKINAHSYDFGFEKDRIGEIRFLGGAFGFYKQLSEKEYLFNELSIEFAYGELEYYEVVGNIYENKNLLEKENKNED